METSNKLMTRAMAAFVVALMAFAVAAPLGQARTPAPGYEAFAGCPSPDEDASVYACIRSTVTGGHFQMGNKDVPITQPIVVSGGVEEELKGFHYNSKGGMSKAKQKVPGGVIGLTGLTWLAEILGSEALTLYAVTELAGTPTLAIDKISLPIKVHLINSTLGNNCYVGSTSNPIKLNLIFGTTSPPLPNKPITGKEPVGFFNESTGVFSFKEGVYVDNSFSAPGASGCVLTLFGFIPISINGLVNSASGLPAAAGTNETVQNITTDLIPVTTVYP